MRGRSSGWVKCTNGLTPANGPASTSQRFRGNAIGAKSRSGARSRAARSLRMTSRLTDYEGLTRLLPPMLAENRFLYGVHSSARGYPDTVFVVRAMTRGEARIVVMHESSESPLHVETVEPDITDIEVAM